MPGSMSLRAGATLLIAVLVLASGPVFAQSTSGGTDGTKKAKLIDFWQAGDYGQRMNIRGRVTSLDGTPLAGINISIRQADVITGSRWNTTASGAIICFSPRTTRVNVSCRSSA